MDRRADKKTERRADKKTERRSDSFLAAEPFASIRLKGESPVMRLSDAPPEEEELSKGEIMESWRITCISRATCSFQKQPKMVNLWNTTATAPVTPFDQIIGPADHALVIDSRVYISTIFSNTVSPAALYSLLLARRAPRDIRNRLC